MSSIFDLTIPVYIRGLEQLSHLLQLGEQLAIDNSLPPETLLTAKLAPDMKASDRSMEELSSY